jgi:hypothetical protein
MRNPWDILDEPQQNLRRTAHELADRQIRDLSAQPVWRCDTGWHRQDVPAGKRTKLVEFYRSLLEMKRKLIMVILLGLAVLCAVSLNAQTPKKSGATLSGVVVGADDKPVPHAGVTCESSAGLRPRAVHTDGNGRFKITGLKQDSYDLRASADGAYSDWERNIPLRKDQTKDITLRLLNGSTALVGTPPTRKKQ